MSVLRKISPNAADRTLSKLGSAWSEVIDSVGPLAWVPLESHIRLLDCTCGVLGIARFREFGYAVVYEALDNPLLFAKPARAALRLFGVKPLTVLRAVPSTLPHIFRDAGTIRLEIPDDWTATVVYEGFPPAFSRGNGWAIAWLGAIHALVTYSSTELDVSVDVSLGLHDPLKGRFEWRVVCQPAAPAKR